MPNIRPALLAGLTGAITSDNEFYALRRDRSAGSRARVSAAEDRGRRAHGRCVSARRREPLRPHFLTLIGFTDWIIDTSVKKRQRKIHVVRKRLEQGLILTIHPLAQSSWQCINMCIWLCMRTNIVLDDKLVKEAFKYSKVKTKKDLVETALKEFVENHRRMDIRDLKGKISFQTNYDYKSMR